jgi:hypothetical protein
MSSVSVLLKKKKKNQFLPDLGSLLSLQYSQHAVCFSMIFSTLKPETTRDQFEVTAY